MRGTRAVLVPLRRERGHNDVVPLANAQAPQADRPRNSNTKIVDFAENIFLPWAQGKRPATYNGYAKVYHGHLREHFGKRRLSEYQPYHASEYLTSLTRRLGEHSLAHVRQVMSNIFAHAVARGYVAVNPIRDAKLLSEPKPSAPTPHYTVAEMRAVLQAVAHDPLALAVMVLAFLGLRPAEMRGLQWQDVDTAAGVLQIRRSAWRKHITEGGKSERSVRSVFFGSFVAGVLERHRAAQQIATTFVLENSARNPLDVWAYATRTIRPLLKAAGVEWKTFYAGRRGSETEMARYTNGNKQLTAPQYGHTHRVAESFYLKEAPAEQREAAQALDEALAGSKGQQATTSA